MNQFVFSNYQFKFKTIGNELNHVSVKIKIKSKMQGNIETFQLVTDNKELRIAIELAQISPCSLPTNNPIIGKMNMYSIKSTGQNVSSN